MRAEVAEWTKAPALRAGVPMGRKGSNPFLGVRKWRNECVCEGLRGMLTIENVRRKE